MTQNVLECALTLTRADPEDADLSQRKMDINIELNVGNLPSRKLHVEHAAKGVKADYC
jgi:hypothetical protein